MVTRFPWREYKRFCLGVLRWSPAEFWQASVWDVAEAYEGYALSKGIKKKNDPSMYPSEESRKALRARLEREKNG